MKLTLTTLLFSTSVYFSYGQLVPFAFWKTSNSDPCSGTPSLGTVCTGGALYAGQFDGGKYMVTPSGCTNSATPTCAGGTDSTRKRWRGGSGSNVNIPGVTNVTAHSSASSSSERGHVTTPVIVAHSSISSDSAADFCNDMAFAGYSDWYLPSKSELAYIYCHSSPAGSHNTSYPEEDPNCSSYGGKTSELTGFANGFYWSSTERNANNAWDEDFNDGGHAASGKNDNDYIRCVRRY